jgi:hypothetical protein
MFRNLFGGGEKNKSNNDGNGQRQPPAAVAAGTTTRLLSSSLLPTSYAALTELSYRHVQTLMEAHEGVWQLSQGTNWDVDMIAGTITWQFPNKIVRAPGQLLGVVQRKILVGLGSSVRSAGDGRGGDRRQTVCRSTRYHRTTIGPTGRVL